MSIPKVNWTESPFFCHAMTRHKDYAAFRLQAAGNADKLDAILQMECRAKMGHKLSETLRCEDFRFPTLLSAEQCTSDELAKEHVALAGDCQDVLDMTCGLGIDAFHIARGCESVTMIDMNPNIAATAVTNAEALGLDNIEIICGDSVEWLRKNDRKFDLIFIDPARRDDGGRRLYNLSDCSPDVVAILGLLKSRGRKVIIKASPMLDVSATFDELGRDTDIYLFGTSKECKELTVMIPGSGRVVVKTRGDQDFSFMPSEEDMATVEIQLPQEGGFLYEPSAALMKSGAFKLVGQRFNLKKIDVNTHLYWSEEHVTDFPGVCRRIIDIRRFGKRLKKELADTICAGVDVAVRNFVLSSADLSKWLGVTKGGDGIRRLYGVRSKGEKLIIVTQSID